MKLTLRLTATIVGALAASGPSVYAQTAMATLSDSPVTGGYNYTVTLYNTGAYPLNGFWYGWTQDGNNLPGVPSNIGNLSAWNNEAFGNSIMWANSTGTPLLPGHNAIFTFFSSASPASMSAAPAGDSVAYVGNIDFSQNVPGDSTDAFHVPLATVPEPSTLALLAMGGVGLMGRVRRGK